MSTIKHVPRFLLACALMALGCGDDDNNGGAGGSAGMAGSGGTGGSAGTAEPVLLGAFELQEVSVDDEFGSPVREDAAYLWFDDDNLFSVLRRTSDNAFRIVEGGVFAIVGESQVFLDSVLYNFTRSGDTLTLSRPGNLIEATAISSAPAPEEWVKPLNPLGTFSIAEIDEARDMTWDGTHLWVGNPGSPNLLYQVEVSTGSVVSTLEIGEFVYALAWDGTSFWVSSNGFERIFKVDPATGDSTTSSVEMGAWPYGIAWDGTHLWVYSSNERTLYEYDPVGDLVVGSILLEDAPGSGGMEIVAGRLYMALGGNIHVVQLDPFAVVDAYELEGAYLEGITHDGEDFYVIARNDEEGVDIHRVDFGALPE